MLLKWIVASMFIVGCGCINLQAQDEKMTYSEGDNWVTDYLKSGGSIENITGLRKPLFETGAKYKSLLTVTDDDLPASYDWNELVQLQPIRRQGTCGACWAFSVTAATEAAMIIFKNIYPIDLAEQTLVSSCSNSGSCSGGYFTALNYIQGRGLPPEYLDPYRASNTKCKAPFSTVSKIKDWFYIGASNREPTTEELKRAIMTYGPISVTVNASFAGYDSGIYNACNRRSTNHMVNLEGWNDDGEYWIMRNSWGKSWGEDGYMRIRYTNSAGQKCNRIGERAAFVIVN